MCTRVRLLVSVQLSHLWLGTTRWVSQELCSALGQENGLYSLVPHVLVPAINYGIRHWAGLVCLINGWQALGIGSGPLTLYRARGEVTSN